MKNKLRLFVVEPNNGGGLVHFAYQMCTALANEGVVVTLITGVNYELAALPHNFRVERILNLWEHFDPESMKVERQNPLKRAWRIAYWALRRVVRGMRMILMWVRLILYLLRAKPDIVQFSTIEYSFEAFFVGYLRHRGVIVSQLCHEFELRENLDPIWLALDRLSGEIYRHFSIIYFLSEEIRRKFLSLHPSISEKSTFVIPHGNSGWLLNIPAISEEVLRHRYGLQENERIVLFFGLLSPSKGLDDLLDAFAIVRKSCDVKLVIAGYPTKHISMNELLERSKTLGISDQIIFDAHYISLEEIRPLMGIALVVVFPYRSGTQSGALQTAYTFGRPVIATAVGGIPDVVDDGKSGYLVPAQSPRELADKIAVLVNNPNLANKMGKYARYLSTTRFSWQLIARRIKMNYEGLLDNNVQ
ncbi:MAG: glycosyltransferase family 4 protein [Anaerolineales bacterium]|nr:glycosyltransferase family 4 protein [Anaerolineales bacterium]